MHSRLYHEMMPMELAKVCAISSNGPVMGVKPTYEILDTSVSNVLYVSDLLRVYQAGGVSRILEIVEDAIVSRLRSIYMGAGIEFDDEICFSKLIDLGLMDEDTTVYLIATFMSIEQAVEEIEELEEFGEKVKIKETLKEIASKLIEIIHILNQLETPAPRYGSERSYYTTDYTITDTTYIISTKGA